MKKQAKELVLKMYHSLKFAIPHHDLNDIFEGAKEAAKIASRAMKEEHKEREEKYDLLISEIEKLDLSVTK
jgi:bifunctional DNase/RNase